MSRESSASGGSPAARETFFTTRWSVVTRAGSGARESRDALESLCASYWFPLYAYARRRGLDHHAAQDAVQGFFARLIEKQDLAAADRSRGRFRSFLLASLSNFLANEWDRERAQKRGGSLSRLSIDEAEAERRYAGDLAVSDAPEKLFGRQWAHELLARARRALAAEWERAGRADLFDRLEPFLTEEASGEAQAAIAAQFQKSENAVRIALHRLRKRFGELLRLEVAETVSDPEEVERELGDLLDAIRS